MSEENELMDVKELLDSILFHPMSDRKVEIALKDSYEIVCKLLKERTSKKYYQVRCDGEAGTNLWLKANSKIEIVDIKSNASDNFEEMITVIYKTDKE